MIAGSEKFDVFPFDAAGRSNERGPHVAPVEHRSAPVAERFPLRAAVRSGRCKQRPFVAVSASVSRSPPFRGWRLHDVSRRSQPRAALPKSWPRPPRGEHVERRRQNHLAAVRRPFRAAPLGLVDGIADPDRPAGERTTPNPARLRADPALLVVAAVRRVAPRHQHRRIGLPLGGDDRAAAAYVAARRRRRVAAMPRRRGPSACRARGIGIDRTPATEGGPSDVIMCSQRLKASMAAYPGE